MVYRRKKTPYNGKKMGLKHSTSSIGSRNKVMIALPPFFLLNSNLFCTILYHSKRTWFSPDNMGPNNQKKENLLVSEFPIFTRIYERSLMHLELMETINSDSFNTTYRFKIFIVIGNHVAIVSPREKRQSSKVVSFIL